MSVAGADVLEARLTELRTLRREAGPAFFEENAERLAGCCHAMAERFARGGRLVALGGAPTDRSDARHVAVEFVHPVIVGKRALPAVGLTGEGGGLEGQLEGVVEPDDIVVAFAAATDARDVGGALKRARLAGAMTLAFNETLDAEWAFPVDVDDPFVAQEIVETLYHVLWELVHVFFDHKGLLGGRDKGPIHDPGASSFLYPFLSEGETDLKAVLGDVRRSILLKSDEVAALRDSTLAANATELIGLASALRTRLDAGGKVLAFGNGGSATDAMDLVADLRMPSQRWPSRRAIDLTEDTGIITAVANDIGVEEIFQRQVIAYASEGDAALALSTSGGSVNIVEALAEARRRGLLTAAFVGYDGGRIASDHLADHVIVSRSQNIPRIQEAQASAYHALRELIELVPAES